MRGIGTPRWERDPEHALVCGAYGPLIDPYKPTRCQVQNGHTGPHRHYLPSGRDIEWQTAYEPLEDLQGDVVYTLPPEDRRGPLAPFYVVNPTWRRIRELVDTGRWEAHCRKHGYGLDTADAIEGPLVDDEDLEQHEQLELEATAPEPPPEPEPAAETATVGGVSKQRIREAKRIDELVELGAPICEDVDEDELLEHDCRAHLIRDGQVHVCHRPEDHAEMAWSRLKILEGSDAPTPKRGQCACGKRRTAEVHGPLEPTGRLEEPLTGG